MALIGTYWPSVIALWGHALRVAPWHKAVPTHRLPASMNRDQFKQYYQYHGIGVLLWYITTIEAPAMLKATLDNQSQSLIGM